MLIKCYFCRGFESIFTPLMISVYRFNSKTISEGSFTAVTNFKGGLTFTMLSEGNFTFTLQAYCKENCGSSGQERYRMVVTDTNRIILMESDKNDSHWVVPDNDE